MVEAIEEQTTIYKEISLDLIDPPDDAIRSKMDEEALAELAGSIREVGILQPLVVKEREGRYLIVAGHRRYVAAKIVDLATVPCRVVSYDEEMTWATRMHENLFREDLAPLDICKYLWYLHNEKDYSRVQIADLIGKSPGYVSRYMAISSWDGRIQEAVNTKKIALDAGRLLMKIEDPDKRLFYLHHATEGGASVEQVAQWVTDELRLAGKIPAGPNVYPPGVPTTPEEALTFLCFMCKNMDKQERSIIIRVCPDCFLNLRRAVRMLNEVEVPTRENVDGTDTQ